MTIVRKAFHIASVSNGEDAVSYEIVPSTSALSVDANGNWASGTALWDQDKSYAVVKCYVYKVVGSKRELCKGTMLYYTAEGSRVSRSVFNNGFFYVYIDKSANVIDACVYAFNMAIGKPVGDPLAMTSITINHDGANGKPIVSYEIRLDTDSVTADGKTGKFLSKDLGRFHFIKHTGDKSEELSKVLDSDNYIIIYVGHDGKTAEYSLGDGSDDIYDCLMMNTEEEAVSLMKFFWYDAPVYVSNGNDKDYDYVEELKATQGIPTEHMNLNILSSAVFTVIRQPKDGERGSAGAIWRHHKGFVDSSETEPYEYMAGGSDEKFIDAVLIGKIWYRCILKYESTGRTDTRNTPGSSEFGKYWSAADMSMAFIATDFFLAENAKINLFGSNEINLYSSSEDGKIFGSFRVPNGNGDGSAYALWLGAETGSEAPFSVTNRGYLKATDAEISGTIMAKGGSIGGFKINEDALGSNNGYNMYLTNNFIHFGNWGAYYHSAGYSINLGYQNRRGVEVSSFSSDTNNINVGGYFHVTANSEKDKGSYCAALELASLWATGAGDIDMTDAEKGNHAILIRNGDVAGLRPSFVRINQSKDLSCYNYNIECYNANDITLTLPDTEDMWGQHLVVIQRGNGKVNFTSIYNIHDLNAKKDSKTWFSGTRGQVSYFWFNGTEWLVRYINR